MHDRRLLVLYGPSSGLHIHQIFHQQKIIISPMVAERLARHNTPVTTVDELRHHVVAAWASVPVHALQFVSDSMPSRISAAISDKGACVLWILISQERDLCIQTS
ncbi:hypothetical protein TNCV_2047321 [Trichonephila clavipes]|uniref:Uncharacterized protein n=1 Tax=Trichonephila clavipes TaxID=2585209 RepID=A0A8X6SRQ5_TRICX|nr:hypothetical protein TNCV_2047321 [Trichonephila clavipes]